jgi:hypothetical protein
VFPAWGIASVDAVQDKETRRQGDKESVRFAFSSCLPFSLSSCLCSAPPPPPSAPLVPAPGWRAARPAALVRGPSGS